MRSSGGWVLCLLTFFCSSALLFFVFIHATPLVPSHFMANPEMGLPSIFITCGRALQALLRLSQCKGHQRMLDLPLCRLAPEEDSNLPALAQLSSLTWLLFLPGRQLLQGNRHGQPAKQRLLHPRTCVRQALGPEDHSLVL